MNSDDIRKIRDEQRAAEANPQTEIERLSERVRVQQRKIKLAFDALALYGVPMERAISIENGIFVLAQRYEREIHDLRKQCSALQNEGGK
jgi:hypothetical protein